MTTQELKKAEDMWLEVAEKDGVMGSHMELKVDKVGLWGCSAELMTTILFLYIVERLRELRN